MVDSYYVLYIILHLISNKYSIYKCFIHIRHYLTQNKRWDIETSFRELKYALGSINFHSKKDDFIKMELFAHFIMFNAVSRSIACVSVPQSNHKYPYAIDFKMACLIVRKYYRLYNEKPPNMMFAKILAYTVPVIAGRSDKHNLKSKSAVWFVYRVA